MKFQKGGVNFHKFPSLLIKVEYKQTGKCFRIVVFHKYRNLAIISRTMHYLFRSMPNERRLNSSQIKMCA